ncbi:hypothetical protein OH799_11665 [Nocardia sp. NBC_00881]|nr:hypothetical protein OH799_11665 [Nocardia sp. NBC_00881]
MRQDHIERSFCRDAGQGLDVGEACLEQFRATVASGQCYGLVERCLGGVDDRDVVAQGCQLQRVQAVAAADVEDPQRPVR